jgi:hypothetical protein
MKAWQVWTPLLALLPLFLYYSLAHSIMAPRSNMITNPAINLHPYILIDTLFLLALYTTPIWYSALVLLGKTTIIAKPTTVIGLIACEGLLFAVFGLGQALNPYTALLRRLSKPIWQATMPLSQLGQRWPEEANLSEDDARWSYLDDRQKIAKLLERGELTGKTRQQIEAALGQFDVPIGMDMASRRPDARFVQWFHAPRFGYKVSPPIPILGGLPRYIWCFLIDFDEAGRASKFEIVKYFDPDDAYFDWAY